MYKKGFLAIILTVFYTLSAAQVRVKDIAQFEGVRSNSLIGYGLVVGLDGTGDQTTQSPFTAQSTNAMLGSMGVNLPPGVVAQTKNTAAVMISADLPAFARPGETLDVVVSSLGNAKSLKGGTLLMTALKGPDGEVYALAQGSVLVGTPTKANPVQLNSGRVVSGGKVERPAPDMEGSGEASLILTKPDFGMAANLEDAINRKLGAGFAKAVNAKRIVLKGNHENGIPNVKIAQVIENLTIESPEYAAKVVINAKTGSLVMGQNLTIGPCAISQNGLTLSIGVSNDSQDKVSEVNGDRQVQIAYLQNKTTLADVVKALNVVGVGTNDLIALIQALKQTGSLRAEVEII